MWTKPSRSFATRLFPIFPRLNSRGEWISPWIGWDQFCWFFVTLPLECSSMFSWRWWNCSADAELYWPTETLVPYLLIDRSVVWKYQWTPSSISILPLKLHHNQLLFRKFISSTTSQMTGNKNQCYQLNHPENSNWPVSNKCHFYPAMALCFFFGNLISKIMEKCNYWRPLKNFNHRKQWTFQLLLILSSVINSSKKDWATEWNIVFNQCTHFSFILSGSNSKIECHPPIPFSH